MFGKTVSHRKRLLFDCHPISRFIFVQFFYFCLLFESLFLFSASLSTDVSSKLPQINDNTHTNPNLSQNEVKNISFPFCHLFIDKRIFKQKVIFCFNLCLNRKHPLIKTFLLFNE